MELIAEQRSQSIPLNWINLVAQLRPLVQAIGSTCYFTTLDMELAEVAKFLELDGLERMLKGTNFSMEQTLS